MIALGLQMTLIVVLIRTIRHRRTAETSLRDSESRLRAFLDHSPSSMFVKDRYHCLVMVNTRYLTLHKVREADIVGKRGGSRLSADERSRMEATDQVVLDSAIPTTSTLRLAGRHDNGKDTHYGVSKFPVSDTEGLVVGVRGINTDVTKLHEREEMLEHAKPGAETVAQEAQVANRTKSEFLASMSHEIRMPLNAVLGIASLLLDGRLAEEQRNQVNTIRSSGEVLLSLFNDILDLSKLEAGKLELENIDFDLGDILKSVADLWSPKAFASGIGFSHDTNDAIAPVLLSDPTRINQILFDLMSNALKYTETGTMKMTVSQEKLADNYIRTRFAVLDSGAGIPPRLYLRFSINLRRPTHPSRESTTVPALVLPSVNSLPKRWAKKSASTTSSARVLLSGSRSSVWKVFPKTSNMIFALDRHPRWPEMSP